MNRRLGEGEAVATEESARNPLGGGGCRVRGEPSLERESRRPSLSSRAQSDGLVGRLKWRARKDMEKDVGSLSLEASTLGERRTKARLLEWMRRGVYVKLARSDIEGVGVVAVRDIPKGTNPFTTCNDHLLRKEVMVTVTESEVRDVAKEPGNGAVEDLVRSFFAPLDDDAEDGANLYGINATGTNTLDVSWYLNHSDDPNMGFVEAEEDGEFNTYVTIKEIPKGAELTVDYRTIGQSFYDAIHR